MKFPSGIIASCSCSYGASAPGVFRINGSAGSMRFEPAFNYDGIHLYGQTTKTPEGAPPSHLDILSPGKAPYQFTIEADYFADCVRNNTVPLSGGEEGWKDLLAIEAIYRAAGSPIA
jgi:predicted dehydrogenase